MSVLASLYTSAMGMRTQSHVMERISGNVANMNTTGYKSFDAHLQDSINHINTKGRFLGVSSVDVRRADKQGVIQATSRALDLALNGQGFFIVNPEFDTSGEQYFTRNGATSSRVGEDGNAYLTTPDGKYIQGWTAGENGAVDTTRTLGPIMINSLDSVPGQVTTELAFAANLEANATTGHVFESNIWSNPDANGVNESYALAMAWTPDPIAQNTWALNCSVRAPDGTVTALNPPTTVTFNGLGGLQSPTDPVSLTVPFADGTSTTLALDLSGMTQYGEGGFTERQQVANGYSAGQLKSLGFNASGELFGSFTNGVSRVMAQLAIADFVAPQNLTDAGNTMFTYNDRAGAIDIFAADDAGDRLAIVPSSLEASTVDVAEEFTTMITTQKAYSTSATVFRSSDEMIQTARDLKR